MDETEDNQSPQALVPGEATKAEREEEPDQTDDLELLTPLDLEDSVADSEPIEPTETREETSEGTDDSPTPDPAPASTPAGTALVPVVARVEIVPAALPLEMDDDDDIDDFDELTLADGIPSAAAPRTPAFFPDVDLDDASSADDLDDPEPSTVEPSEDGRHAAAPGGDDLDAEDDHATPGTDDDDLELVAPREAPPDERRAERNEVLEIATSLSPEPDEAPDESLGSGLALQPIPELQSEQSLATHDEMPAIAIGDWHDPDDTAGDDDDLDASLSKADIADIDALEIDGLDAEKPDQADDDVDDDWHAHLADVLGSDDDRHGRAHDEHPDVVSAADEADPPGVLPLSTTLAHIAATGETATSPIDDRAPDTDDHGLISPLLTRTARKRSADSRSPSAPSTDWADLPPAQLSVGIIACVPRMRRLAAVQIGDEREADRLVQKTVEAALANPSSLRPAADLGLALITLLHRRRRDMLNAPRSPRRAPGGARAFEKLLCRGLAGADQFEIHQFAGAISSLDEPDRQLLVLVALENLPYDQIAGVIREPIERIMVMVSRARMNLRQVLASDDQDNEDEPSTIHIPHAQEVEIHGYLDGELDGRHMADIDALIEHDEDAADRLLQYGIQGDLIRRLYAPLLNRPIPAAMLEALSAAAKPARRVFRFGSRRALLAGAILIVVGGSAVLPYVGTAFDRFTSAAIATIER